MSVVKSVPGDVRRTIERARQVVGPSADHGRSAVAYAKLDVQPLDSRLRKAGIDRSSKPKSIRSHSWFMDFAGSPTSTRHWMSI
jgi:hypothetical protein